MLLTCCKHDDYVIVTCPGQRGASLQDRLLGTRVSNTQVGDTVNIHYYVV